MTVGYYIDPATGLPHIYGHDVEDLTFEAVIMRHPDKFSQAVVTQAKERLEELETI